MTMFKKKNLNQGKANVTNSDSLGKWCPLRDSAIQINRKGNHCAVSFKTCAQHASELRASLSKNVLRENGTENFYII